MEGNKKVLVVADNRSNFFAQVFRKVAESEYDTQLLVDGNIFFA
jgi:hypothetical protein